jgi:hypothetical protein
MGRNGDHRSASHICYVEGSETSLAIGLQEMNAQNNQRFFSRGCGIRMTKKKGLDPSIA